MALIFTNCKDKHSKYLGRSIKFEMTADTVIILSKQIKIIPPAITAENNHS
jgi:hypothetical protein